MPVRIDIELTSARPDDSWTWRKAGAREPKGVVSGQLVPGGSKVGDTLRAEAESDIDGMTIVSVLPSKGARKGPDLLEILGSGRDFEPVVSTLAPKRERRDRPRRDDGDRPPRRDRPAGDRPRGQAGDRPPRGDRPPGARTEGTRPPRDGADRGADRPRRDRPERPPRPELPSKPKPKRLRPGRVHVNAVLSELPDEHRPIAEHVLRGGVPAVRQAIDEQNKVLAGEGKPTVKADALVDLATALQPRLRVAEWRDRAEAALAGVDELDLRDLRSVVAASNDSARDEATRELATQLREALSRRQDRDQSEWLAEIVTELDGGRSIRALRLSSRPPKAGVPFPPDLAGRLSAAVSGTLTAEAPLERWIAAIDALAFSPVRAAVTPAGIPAAPGDELRAAVARVSSSLPEIAKAFGLEPSTAPPRAARGGAKRPSKPLPPKPPRAAAPAAPPATEPSPADDGASIGEAAVAPPVESDAAPVEPASPQEAPPATEPAAETDPVSQPATPEATEPAAETDPVPEPATPEADVPVAEVEPPAPAPAVMADEPAAEASTAPDGEAVSPSED